MKQRVLFVCVLGSARSQMAQAFLNQMGGDRFEAHSAGFEPTAVNPLVVEAMREAGIDLSDAKTQSVYDLYRQGVHFWSVITVCDRAREAECPVFPGIGERLHWDLENPEDFSGSKQQVMQKVRALRDKIRQLVREYIDAHPS